jgi:multicomponent Na+:H+ antiporter subunit E
MAAVSVFLACLAFWVVLSGHFTALNLVLALLSSAAVTFLNRDIEAVSRLLRVAPAFLGYLPWLLKEIVVANLQVARVVLDPALPIDPVVVRFKAPLSQDLALMTLGNSITLTPGTITLDVEGREFVVHALTTRAGADLVEGSMAQRVGRVFGDSAP